MTRPTPDEIETALDVLLWLHEVTDDGHARDDVSRVRYMLDNPTWEQWCVLLCALDDARYEPRP